jgi:hypothetical protein
MSKQTAVEWLVEQLKEYDFGTDDEYYVIKIPSWILTEKEEQAKEMEKEQKIMDYEMGYINGGNQKKITGEQYYNETYEGNK